MFEVIYNNIEKIILPILYILIGIIVFNIIKGIINKTVKITKGNLKSHQKQRMTTVKTFILNIVKYTICIFVILAILATFGINVKSILAGLGIGAAIIGLAFQDLAKDLIAGISIITEGQYEVGDTIEVEGFMGEVVFLGLKTTRIKDYKGATKIIANRYMDKMINYSLENSLAIVDVSVSYDHSNEEVEKVINELFKKLNGKMAFAKGELQLWGVNNLDDSSVVYRIALEVESMQHFAAERFLRKEIKEAFDKANIKIPYPQVEVHNGK